MLSRVADCLFWMSRYLERAESVARLLNATFHRDLDLAGTDAGDDNRAWLANLSILQQALPDGVASPHAIASWLTFELSNPGSIIGCVNRARNNARGIRGTVGPEVWRAINALYWQLRDADFESRARHSPFDYYQAVESGCHLFQGVCDATLPHDEGWQFIALGRSLERADKTLRLLAVKWTELNRLTDDSLKALEWGGVLKGANAFEAYQRAAGRVEPERVIEFLLLDTNFPRAVRFSLEGAARALSAIDGFTDGRSNGRAERQLGRLLSDLKYTEPGHLVTAGFHDRLNALLQQCVALGRTIHDQYMLTT